MQYLRNARFLRVRDALIRAEGEHSVTEIAMSWGFSHMGRFSLSISGASARAPPQCLKRQRTRP